MSKFEVSEKFKNMCKKGISIVLTLGVIGSFSACGNEKSSSDSNGTNSSISYINEDDIELFTSNRLSDVELWQVRTKEDEVVPMLVQINYWSGWFDTGHNHVDISDFESGSDIVGYSEDKPYDIEELGGRDLYWANLKERALSNFEEKVGKIEHKQELYQLLLAEYGQKSKYSLNEILKVRDNHILVEEETTVCENVDANDVTTEVVETTTMPTTVPVKEITAADVLRNSKSVGESYHFAFQDRLYDETIDPEECYENATMVKEVVDKNGDKYLISNDESTILISDYDSIGEPYFVVGYQDESTNPWNYGNCYVVEVTKNGVNYLVDASDPTKIIASGFDNVAYEHVNSIEGMSSHPAFSFTYADGRTESIYCHDAETETSNVLVKK